MFDDGIVVFLLYLGKDFIGEISVVGIVILLVEMVQPEKYQDTQENCNETLLVHVCDRHEYSRMSDGGSQ